MDQDQAGADRQLISGPGNRAYGSEHAYGSTGGPNQIQERSDYASIDRRSSALDWQNQALGQGGSGIIRNPQSETDITSEGVTSKG